MIHSHQNAGGVFDADDGYSGIPARVRSESCAILTARFRHSRRTGCHRAQKQIQEVNAGVYVASPIFYFAALERVKINNEQGEYYLPDIVTIGSGRKNSENRHLSSGRPARNDGHQYQRGARRDGKTITRADQSKVDGGRRNAERSADNLHR